MLRRAEAGWRASALSIGAWQCDDQVTNQHVSRPQLLAYTRVKVRLLQPIDDIDLPAPRHLVL